MSEELEGLKKEFYEIHSQASIATQGYVISYVEWLEQTLLNTRKDESRIRQEERERIIKEMEIYISTNNFSSWRMGLLDFLRTLKEGK